MKPFREHLPLSPDASWSLLNRRLDDAIPFEWHHHPEYELTLTLNSRGQRFIGTHVGSYGDADLVLVGPNLPHTWMSRDKLDPAQPHVALVFWFRKEWLDELIKASVELQPLRRLLERGAAGLAFPEALARSLRSRIEAIFEADPAARLFGLLDILLTLARSEAGEPLSAEAVPEEGGRQRIDRVLTHLHRQYRAGVSIGELAEIAALSPSGLHRLFRKATRQTVSEYLIALRIGEACARLSAGDEPIGHIAGDIGYASLANFNRQFRRLRGMSPRAYRQLFRG